MARSLDSFVAPPERGSVWALEPLYGRKMLRVGGAGYIGSLGVAMVGLAVPWGLATPCAAQSVRGGVLVEWEEESAELDAALEGALGEQGYSVVPPSQLRSALAFAGVEGPLTPEIAERARAQLELASLFVISVNADGDRGLLVAVRRHAEGTSTTRFGETTRDELTGFAISRIAELEQEARAMVPTPPNDSGGEEAPTAPPLVAAVNPTVVAVAAPVGPPPRTGRDRPAQGGGGDGVIVAGVGALLGGYVLAAVMSVALLELTPDRIGIAFIPVAGPFWNLSYVDFDDPDQTGDAIIFGVIGVAQGVGLILLTVGLIIDASRGGGEQNASTDPEVGFAAAPLAEGGMAASLWVRGL